MRFGRERRGARRHALRGRALVDLEGKRLHCALLDLSETGMGLLSPEPLERGEVVAVTFALGQQTPVQTHAVVQRAGASRSHYACGLRFLGLEPRTEQKLRRFFGE